MIPSPLLRIPEEALRFGAAIHDPQWLMLTWFGQTIDRLCASQRLELLRGEIPAWLAHLPGVASGHILAASPDLFAAPIQGPAVVVGGPCIGDCTRFPTLETLYDAVQPVRVAKALGVPAVLYVGDREETFGRPSPAKWLDLGERMERWLERLLPAVGCDQVTIVRTSRPRHEEALSALGGPAGKLAGDHLDRAFHLGSTPVRMQDDEARAATRRVIEAHLPEVVARHLGLGDGPLPTVVMVENLQQSGVFHAASACSGGAVELLAYCPAPSPSAAQRMYRAPDWDKIPAAKLDAMVEVGAAALHPATRQFFATWLEPDLRRELSEAAARW